MRSDLKIGIVVGIVVVAGVLVFLVRRNDSPEAAPETSPPPIERVQRPVEPPAAPPVEPVVAPPAPEPAPVEVIVPGPELEPAPEPEPVPVDKPDVRAPRYHVVKKGDSLSGIAEQYYGQGKHWPIIVNANKNLIKNKDVLQVGWKLRIPYPEEIIRP